MPIQELSFNSDSAVKPWISDGASDYEDWSGGNDELGTFASDGERYGFVRVNAHEGYSHYVVGSYPASDEMWGLKESPEAKEIFTEYLSASDMQVVHVYKDEVKASFVHGPRACKPCIVCSKELLTVNTSSSHVENQPSGGTNFTSRGHYGSTVFDPDGRESISINICDECLRSKAQEGFVTHIKERKRIVDESIRTDWDPNIY